jgi:hypothetical protein
LIIVVWESVPTSVSGMSDAVALGDDVGEVLEVDLVHDARPRRHDPKVGEGLLRPAQEGVALAIALVLALDVDQERGVRAELVDLHAVVDHQVSRHERVDLRRVTAHLGHRVAHRRQVHDARDTGEVLEDDPGRHEGQLRFRRLGRIPRGEGADVVRCDEVGLGRRASQHVLEQHLHGVGQAGQVRCACSVEAVVRVLAVTDAQGVASGGGVGGCMGRHGRLLSSPRHAASVEDRRRTGAPVAGRLVRTPVYRVFQGGRCPRDGARSAGSRPGFARRPCGDRSVRG